MYGDESDNSCTLQCGFWKGATHYIQNGKWYIGIDGLAGRSTSALRPVNLMLISAD
jgi:hypothetical protein